MVVKNEYFSISISYRLFLGFHILQKSNHNVIHLLQAGRLNGFYGQTMVNQKNKIMSNPCKKYKIFHSNIAIP